MQTFFYYLGATLALVSADGYYYESPGSQHWSPLAPTHQYQYHTQDGYGQYSYGYGEPLSTKQEVRTLDGITRGSYTYLDATGKLQTVAYTADANGFHVSATNLPKVEMPSNAITVTTSTADTSLPQSVQETAEVAAARIQHLAAHQQAKLRLYQITPQFKTSTAITHGSMVKKVIDNNSNDFNFDKKHVDPVESIESDILPQSVVDTPEVAAAKAEFFKHYDEVKQRNEKLRQQQEQQTAGYALVRSPPIALKVPYGNYQPIVIPNAVYGYNVPVNSKN